MIYNIPDHICGDSWIGVDSITILDNDYPLNLTDCDIYIQFRSDRNLASPSVFDLSTDEETILVVNPLSGILSIPKININLPPQTYVYDVQVNFPNGDIKTYFGGSFSILPHTTRIANNFKNKNNEKIILSGDEKDRILTTDGERLNYI